MAITTDDVRRMLREEETPERVAELMWLMLEELGDLPSCGLWQRLRA